MTAGGSSIPALHPLLAVLAAGRRAAEVGTAFGDGAEAIAATAASLVTVDIDPERAARARSRLARHAHVDLLVGDWRTVLPPRGPFEFVFLDGGGAKVDEAALDLVAPGGLVVMDDFTPNWPGHDPVRDFWFSRPDFVAVEILTTPLTSAIVAARRAAGA